MGRFGPKASLKLKDRDGWDYWWPKPGEEKPSKKRAKMPSGELVIVGAGIYGE
jgi:hypothetical protein